MARYAGVITTTMNDDWSTAHFVAEGIEGDYFFNVLAVRATITCYEYPNECSFYPGWPMQADLVQIGW
jgi:hypothetical protein